MSKRQMRGMLVIEFLLLAGLLLIHKGSTMPSDEKEATAVAAPAPVLAKEITTNSVEEEGEKLPQDLWVLRQEIEKRIRQEEYSSAYELLEVALTHQSLYDWSTTIWPDVLAQATLQKLQQGECSSAITLYKELRQRHLVEPILHKGLAACYYRSGYPYLALEHLQAYQGQGFDPEALMLRYQLETDLLRLDAAEVTLAQLDSQHDLLDYSQQGFLESEQSQLGSLKRRSSSLSVVESKNIQVVFDSSAESFAEIALDIGDQAIAEYGEIIGLPEPQRKIQIYILPKGDFRAVFGIQNWIQGYFDGKIKIAKDNFLTVPAFTELLRHELVHALLSIAGVWDLPTWFDEGLAQWLAEGGEQKGFTYPVVSGKFLSSDELSASFSQHDRLTAHYLYRQSLFLIQLLVNRVANEGVRVVVEGLVNRARSEEGSLLAILGIQQDEFFKTARYLWNNRLEPRYSLAAAR